MPQHAKPQPQPQSQPLTSLVTSGAIAADWLPALEPVASSITTVLGRVAEERAAGTDIWPSPEHVWAAFARPFSDVRVVIIGQDPYPTPGHAHGLAFSADADVRPIPRSVANIYRELHTDLGIVPAAHADLSSWADQGVLLLNRVLTVRAGDAGSHRGLGWEAVTDRVIDALVQRDAPLVAVLWGNDARALAPRFGEVPVVESAHPSPLSASRGFFGSRPFSQVNERLREQGSAPIVWHLPELSESGMLW